MTRLRSTTATSVSDAPVPGMLATVRSAPAGFRVGAVLIAGAVLALIIAALGPQLQDQAFHGFADTCAFGIAHFGNVASNIGYLVVGLWGLWVVYAKRAVFDGPVHALPFAVFFAGFILVGIGSAYYHAAPVDRTLAWDRAAMTVVFGAGLAAFVGDRMAAGRWGLRFLVAALAFGVASIVYWRWTGDLRLYRFDQAAPMVLAPLIAVLFERRVTSLALGLAMLALFALATLCELRDRAIFDALGGVTSGHVIKHFVSALAAVPMIVMILTSRRGGGRGQTPTRDGVRS